MVGWRFFNAVKLKRILFSYLFVDRQEPAFPPFSFAYPPFSLRAQARDLRPGESNGIALPGGRVRQGRGSVEDPSLEEACGLSGG